MKKKALEEELEDLEGKLLRAEKLLSGKYSSPISAVVLITAPLKTWVIVSAVHGS